jgi:hydrogenase maturation protein HypF
MAENGLAGPVIGVAYDGTGHGTDGAAWGGEVMCADLVGFERVATFRPIRLAGGDRAIHEVWRTALALLLDAFDGDPPLERLALFRRVPAPRVAAVRRLLESGVACARAHGVGRYFDGFGALALGRPEADFSGEVALAWNLAARDAAAAPGRFALDTGADPLEIDLRPLVRESVDGLLAGRPPAELSARFHATLAAATAAAVRVAVERHGRLPVVLTGGCFQNALLAERVHERLRARHRVLLHREVPPGDGGIALGQALVAAARLASGREEDPACV